MHGQLIKRGPRTWLLRVLIGRDANGKRVFINTTIHGTKREAEEKRTELAAERQRRGFLTKPTKQTVAEFLATWLETTAAARVRPITLASYRALLTRHVFPDLGRIKLCELRSEHIQQLYNTMTETRGLSTRTVRYVHAILRTALHQATITNAIPLNPVGEKRVAVRSRMREERRALSGEETQRFLNAAEPNAWGALWTLLVTTGLRPSEALALRWTDLDGTRLRIQRGLTFISAREHHFCDPKTRKSRRAVHLPARAVRLLAARRRQQAEDRLLAGELWEANDLIFCDPIGRPVNIQNLRASFRRVLKAADLPSIPIYSLRHTAASLLLAEGRSVKDVSELLGHSTVTLTLDTYAHVMDDQRQETAATMDRVVGS
jgi:integrase